MPVLPAPSTGRRRSTTESRPARFAVRAVPLALVVGAQVWIAGPAAANAAGATLRYTCTVKSLPSQSVTARLEWNAPDSVVVGRPTPELPLEITTTLSPAVTAGAGMIGVAAVEATVDATGVVKAPEGDIGVDVPLTVPRTAVPESGPMTVVARGAAPGLVFHRPGTATVAVGDALVVGVDLWEADGDPAADHVDASCVLDPGQNTVLSSFEITPAERAPAPDGAAVGASASRAAGPPWSSASDPAPGGLPGQRRELAAAPHPTAGTVSPSAAVVAAGGTAGWWLLVGAVVVAGLSGSSWWLLRRRRG